jgi:Uma2 family endonuclease
MSQAVRWTIADLELLPENSSRYEVIGGELFVTRAPHWGHQKACSNTSTVLNNWSAETGLGEAVQSPGVIFSEADAVIPDVVWVSRTRLAVLMDEAGHLTGAPELIVEVLSPGVENERRDREAKLKLYAIRGVLEYWILNWRLQQIEVYRRQDATLALVGTLFATEPLTSPLLPGFSCAVERLFV